MDPTPYPPLNRLLFTARVAHPICGKDLSGFLFILVILLITYVCQGRAQAYLNLELNYIALGFKMIEFDIKWTVPHSASVKLNGRYFYLRKNLIEEMTILICNQTFFSQNVFPAILPSRE